MKIYLAVILTFIITAGLGIGGIYYFFNKKATVDKNNLQSQINDLNTKLSISKTEINSSTASTTAVSNPETLVTNFYNWYTTEGADHNLLASAPGGSEALQTWYDGAINAMQSSGGGADPVVCAQDTPPSFTVATVVKDASAAQVRVTENFTPLVLVTVNLKFISGQWQLTNITCPSTN